MATAIIMTPIMASLVCGFSQPLLIYAALRDRVFFRAKGFKRIV
jgi:hypothetical protein